jgi:UDP-N-acetylmuramoyl-L-alanyl-D-glutamate--2,6-diaminopimelate ligase
MGRQGRQQLQLPKTFLSSEAVEKRLLCRGMSPRWQSDPPAGFAGLALDSRTVGSGDLFCAIPGTVVDGHEYVAQAASSGAAAAVVERVVHDVPIPQLVVTDTHAAATHLASLFTGDPGLGMRLIGITGTNGKTTTAWLARYLLADLESTAAIGTLGSVDPAGRVHPGQLTTPGPLELMETLAALSADGVETVAMEVSSHALDQRRVDGLRFDAVAFTSFSREHLEYHPDLAHYLEAKLRIVELLEPEGLCVVNADEPAWESLDTGSIRRVSYGFSADADVRAEEPRFGPDGSDWLLVTGSGTARVHLPLPGRFNVQNALAAAAIALEAGLVPTRVAELLSAAPSVTGRMEVLQTEPVLVLRDYAHTPDSYERVLGSLREDTSGKLFVVFGCGGDRDRGKRPLMGEIATRYADLTIVTTDNPRSEDPAAIAEEIVADRDPDRWEIVLDRRAAIARALELGGRGDVVVLLGKGHETYQVIGRERIPFDEAAIVAELTASHD